MRLPLITTVTALLFASQTIAAELGIETTHSVPCTRKTTKGDTVQMHYRGRLQESGEEFDASYNRGQPLVFALGTGRVIKGLAPLPLSLLYYVIDGLGAKWELLANYLL